MKLNKICQSCGMPLKRDTKGGGTTTDGSKSTDYCSYCFVDGNFTFTGTVKEFQEVCRQEMIKGGHNRFSAWLFSRGMKRLERWKS